MTRRIHLASALVTALALTTGCDSGKDNKPAKPGTADAKTDAKKDAKTDVKADAKTDAKADTKTDAKADGGDAADGGAAADGGGVGIDEAEKAKLKEQAAEVKKHLTDARAKAKESDWKGAVEAYTAAAKIDDDNPKILEELGWAQFEAEDYEKAEHNIKLALRFAQTSDHRADIFYKLGRVEEQRGDYVNAKKHYDHSLKLKDNPEVKEHDDAVTPKAEAACKGGKCIKPDYEDLEAACAAMVARVHEQQGLEPHSADDEFNCDATKPQKIALEGGDATEAAILVVKGAHAGTEEEEYDLLAHIDGGWHWVGTILDLENPHHGGIERSGSIKSLEAKELLPDSPGQEIVVELTFTESDADLDDNIVYHDEHDAFVVCGVSEGKHVCYEIPSRMKYVAEALDPKQPTAHDLSGHEFTATVVFDGKGGVTVSGTGEVPESEKGTHKISELPEPAGFVFLHEN